MFSFLVRDNPSSEHVITCYPWNRSEDTPDFTGLPVDVLYMAKVEKLQMEIIELKHSLLVDNVRIEKAIVDGIENSLDMQSVGGDGYGLSKRIDRKLDDLIAKISSPIAAPTLPHPDNKNEDNTDDGFWTGDVVEEEDICLTYEEDQSLAEQARQSTIRERTKYQLIEHKKRGVVVGFHHGHLNPLPSLWQYPKQMNLIQMITLFLMGSPIEGVTPLKYLKSPQVVHFDKDGSSLARMRRVMNVVKHYAIQKDAWEPRWNATIFWNGETVTHLWDSIWEDVAPYLLTRTQTMNNNISYHKSRSAALSWRTCHDKFRKLGVFKMLGV